LKENKLKTFEKIETINKKLANLFINEIEKLTNEILLSSEEREYIFNKIIKSSEFQKYSKIEIDSIYETNIFQVETKK